MKAISHDTPGPPGAGWRWAQAAAGLMLALVGAAGAVHAGRAGSAELLYYRAKYGAWQHDADRGLAAVAKAHARYPWNYQHCIWAAETAFYGGWDEAGNERPGALDTATLWCRRGLDLNPYKSQLVLLDVRLTAYADLAAATRRWEAFVDWNYWDPHNHAVLVELYSRQGLYDKAIAALAMVNDRRLAQDARRHLQEALAAEMSAMEYYRGAAGRQN